MGCAEGHDVVMLSVLEGNSEHPTESKQAGGSLVNVNPGNSCLMGLTSHCVISGIGYFRVVIPVD